MYRLEPGQEKRKHFWTNQRMFHGKIDKWHRGLEQIRYYLSEKEVIV